MYFEFIFAYLICWPSGCTAHHGFNDLHNLVKGSFTISDFMRVYKEYTRERDKNCTYKKCDRKMMVINTDHVKSTFFQSMFCERGRLAKE